ncbi:hypothetical protein IL306_005027 [Fusarium sp. DS 682]|nr:hypothetical protein IL306_005027 [Fusarium sp. DS 682]
MGSIKDAENTTFAIQDAPVENLRPLRVVLIGTGFSGILAAIRIPQRLKNIDLVVYDKNDGVGGVWNITITNLITGETFRDAADILVSARGGLNDVAWPNISGLDKFKGNLLHSAEWDESYVFNIRFYILIS